MTVRLRGLVKVLVGLGLAVAAFLLLGGGMYSASSGHNMDAVKAAALPLMLALVGLLELLSGVAFYRIARKWDAMHGLVRFLLGLVIILASVPVVVLVLALVMSPG